MCQIRHKNLLEFGVLCAVCARGLLLRDLVVAMITWQDLKQLNQNILEYLKEKTVVNKTRGLFLSIIYKYFFWKSSFSNSGWNWSWNILTNSLFSPLTPANFWKFTKKNINYKHIWKSCSLYMPNGSSSYTGLFISASGISELECATTKADTAERNISIGRESLQVFFVLGALAYIQVPPLEGSRDWRKMAFTVNKKAFCLGICQNWVNCDCAT